jgi:hypothetical protein
MNTKARKANSAKGAIELAFPSAPKLLVVALAMACTSSVAVAANVSWNSDGGDGNWSTNSKWSGGSKPIAGDSVTINPTKGNFTVIYDGTGYTNNSLTINSLSLPGVSPDTLTLTGTSLNSSTLSVTNSFTAFSDSTVNVNQYATLNLNGTSSLGIFNLAGTLGGTGTVTASGLTTWSGGTMTGSGSTSASGGLTVSGPAVLQRTLSGSKLTINSGSTLDIQADKNLTFTQGIDGTITNNGTLKKTGGSGTTNVTTDTILTNTGTIIANAGTLSFAQGVSGTAGTLQTTGGILSLGANSTAGTVNIGSGGLVLNNKSLTVSSDYINNFGTGNSFNRTASVTTGGANGLIKAADITGGVTVGSFQQLSIDGGATTSAGNVTLALGNIHVNSSIGTQYGIYNKEATGGVTLRGAIQGTNVDSRLSESGVDVTGSSWSAAAGGSTNKTVTLTGSSAGGVDSTVKIVNNFTNTNSQDLRITGGVYQYAQVGAPNVVFGNRHVGDAASQALSITNTDISPAEYQEKLNASVTGSAGSATGSGSFTGLTAGATNSSIVVGLNTIAAGNQSGSVTITPVSNGTGTSGLGNTTLNNKIVNVSGGVYALAQPTFTGSNPVNFGIVHVGDTASQAVGITNTSAAPAGYQEKLNASISTASTGITTSGVPISIDQGNSSNALNVGINTATAGARSGTATVALVSDGAGTSGLGTTTLTPQTINVSGQVNSYATVRLAQTAGAGTFSGSGTSYVLDLGTITLGTGSANGSLSLTNTGGMASYTDYLSGNFGLVGVTDFTLTGFTNFYGLSGGSSLNLGVALNNNAVGSFSQYVMLSPTGYNDSGYSGALSPIQLVLKGNVVAAVPEPASYAMFIAGLGLMAGIARRRRQQG